MTALDVPPTPVQELPRGRGDGGWRLARRTQRGQGGRRVLVVVLVALSVGLGVLAGAWTSTLARADLENTLLDRFGPADLVIEDTGALFSEADVTLTAEQLAWLEAHPGPSFEGPFDDTTAPEAARTVDEVLAQLPAGSEVLRYRHDGLYGYGQDALLVTDLDVTAPLGARTFDTGGRTTPLVAQQGLASPGYLRSIGAEVGDVVQVTGVGEVEVVGTLTRAAARSAEVVVVAPGRAIDRPSAVDAVRVALPGGALEPTVDAIRGANDAAQLEAGGDFTIVPELAVATEFVEGQDDPASVATLVGTVVSGFAVTVAALVAACAFAVGVRRRLRQLGMLGAVGASPAQLARLVRREGFVIGLLGGAAGLAAGVAVAFAGQPLLERLVDRDVTVSLPPVAVVPPVLLGALAAMVAAWWPARTAARIPVVAALAGRVPTGRVPAWLPVLSAVVAAAGIGMFVLALRSETTSLGFLDRSLPLLGASIVATLGVAGLGLPVLVLGGRLADRIPVLPRMALRDAARRRTRSGAAIAALIPVLALPVAGLVVATADDGFSGGEEPWVTVPPSLTVAVYGPSAGMRVAPPSTELVDAVAGQLPVSGERAELVELGQPRGYAVTVTWRPDGRRDDAISAAGVGVASTQLGVATPDVLALLDLPQDAVVDGEVLVLRRGLSTAGPQDGADVVIVGTDARTGEIALDRPLPARVLADVEAPPNTGALVTPATADELGLVEVGRHSLLGLQRPITDAEQAALWQVTGDRGFVIASTSPTFWETRTGSLLATLLAALAVLAVVCVVAGMTAALAATESDDDLRRAVALGAEPGMRRRFHGVQAWWHAAVAGVLGTGLGLVIGCVVVAESGYLLLDDQVWLAAVAWALLAPVAVGLVIAVVMRPSRVEAPRRRMA